MRDKHTSQWSRMAERIPMTDLSGGKASARSFAGSIVNLVAECPVEVRLNASSSVALGLTVFSESFACSSRPIPTTDRVKSWAATSALRGGTVR